MGQSVQQKPVFAVSYSVDTATPTYVDTMALPFPLSVSALPGGGGTMAVAYSTTPGAAGSPGTATWFNWPSGAVATSTNDILLAPSTGLRFTATAVAGAVEVVA